MGQLIWLFLFTSLLCSLWFGRSFAAELSSRIGIVRWISLRMYHNLAWIFPKFLFFFFCLWHKLADLFSCYYGRHKLVYISFINLSVEVRAIPLLNWLSLLMFYLTSCSLKSQWMVQYFLHRVSRLAIVTLRTNLLFWFFCCAIL